MALSIYNTLTQKKELFTPLNPPKVGMYVCGVTVYDLSHIGHARSAITFDIIARYLRHLGYELTYVRNYTDIDDKIIKRAAELFESTDSLTKRTIRAFEDDMAALGLLRPDHEPRCTVFVPQMVTFIEKLVATGYAYPAANGDVYYRVGKFKSYGKLSKKNIDELQAGARVESSADKEDALDFALWKAAKPGEPCWPSPWGDGRPGWHIECSVMSTAELGPTLDIHGGGKDLIFPHHENEIAQSEAHNNAPYARFWIHNGFVNVPSDDNPEGAKMSKSLGNFYTIRDVLAAYDAEAVKLLMLGTHYRKDVLFTEDGLAKAQERLAYYYESLKAADAFLAANPAQEPAAEPAFVAELCAAFAEAMDDDFNTSRVIGEFATAFKTLNERVAAKDDAAEIAALLKALRKLGAILGLFTRDPQQVERDLKALKTSQSGVDAAAVEALIAKRIAARAARDFAQADAIRKELDEMGVVIMDSKAGTTWTLKG